MKDIVFLGPSLPLDAARAICAADYRPPVRMGDVYRAVGEQPRAIAIIDGLFERVPAVWHKEILYALHRGIPVYGGASMGALRAAELDAFGMIGVGSIYRDFATGVLNDDDEVAVAHANADHGYRATSVAMVNLRAGLAAAVKAGVLTPEAVAQLLLRSKARFYPERTWEALLIDAAELLGADRSAVLRGWIATTQPDCKRDDAVAVLHALVAARTAAPVQLPAFEFEHTVYWETVETYCGQHGFTDASAQFERVRNHVRIFASDREQLVDRALLLFLAEQEVRRLKLPVPDDRSALAAFRSRRGLESVAALNAWLGQQKVSKPECLDLARLEARVALLRDQHMAAVDRYLVPQLKLEGRYATSAAHVAAKWQTIAGMEIGQISEHDVGALDDVLAWYQQHHGRISGSLDQHVAQLGLGTLHQWREELFAEYLVTTSAPPAPPAVLSVSSAPSAAAPSSECAIS